MHGHKNTFQAPKYSSCLHLLERDGTSDWLEAPNSSPTPASCQGGKGHWTRRQLEQRKDNDVPRPPLFVPVPVPFRGAVMEVCCAFLDAGEGQAIVALDRPISDEGHEQGRTQPVQDGGVTTPSGRSADT